MRLLAAIALLLATTLTAQTQGCGQNNPNCVVPTRPSGTNDNTAASTAFVHNSVSSGGGSGIVVAVRSSAATTVTISAMSDYFLCLDPTGNAIQANLPPSPTTGLTFLLKDCTGHAGSNNITVTPTSANIDGASTFVMNVNYQSIAVTYTGTQWSVN